MADQVVEQQPAEDVAPGARPSLGALRALTRNRAALAGVAILVVFAVLAVTAPLLTPYDPTRQVLASAFQGPSWSHPLGTDGLGRDILARIMYGGRYTLMIGVLSVSIATGVGVPLGLASGYLGGWVDLVIQRIADIMLAFNPFLLALALVAVLGVGLRSVIIAAGLGVMPQFIRLARGLALSLREEVYVEAAEAFGASRLMILRRHLLRNALTPIIVYATLNIGLTILVAAGLGFLGLGVQPPVPEWGTMLGEGREYIFHAAYTSTFPGLAIFLVVLGFNLAGDGLRDALDPNLRA
ncbi:MAG: ABC transporter permease subunit [Streptosporangiales bacterium]|nr:ABC transporter permease subunit [Streptosporangiales bacterium]